MPVVVVHDVGDDGSAWRHALSMWPDDAVAPDLVVNGAVGDRTDVVWLLLELMDSWRDRGAMIVGCGEHSLAAETFALAGWVGGLALVDGLGGAWTTPEQQVDAQNVWLRAKYENPELVGYPRVWVEPFDRVRRAHIRCPVLLIETPASITPVDEAERRGQQFAHPAALVRLDSRDPVSVLAAIKTWMGS